MSSLILEERDQQFVLYEMLDAEKICNGKFSDFSKDIFDMIIAGARKLAEEEIFPVLADGDRQGCRLENGQVRVPEAFHRVYKLFCEGGWNAMTHPTEYGGQGLPVLIKYAAFDWFTHNFAFVAYPGTNDGSAHLIEVYGTDEQKSKYLDKIITGEWAGTMGLTEPDAGTDVGNLSTRAIRQPDGTFRIQGTKIFISGGDQDLTENIIHPTLARIEGDPAGTKGISIFLIPKFMVGEDGSLGKRNDYEVAGIESKLGIHGSATCLINFGDNGGCYAELLGEERQGMRIMFQMMNEMRLGVGLQGLSSGSAAYLHALEYSKQRIQGPSLENFKDPQAPRVPIIMHPDVRRMLLWMKSNVDSMRALIYYTAHCFDIADISEDEAEREKWLGLTELLTPLCKAYCSDVGFRVCDTAMQVHGGYGYCTEYPIEQFMRDEKIACIYEGTNSIQAMDLISRKLGMKKGLHFMNLMGEINSTIASCRDMDEIKDLVGDVEKALEELGSMAMYFGMCSKDGKFLVPVLNAFSFLMVMGRVVSAWLLLWQARVSVEKLEELCDGVGRTDTNAMAGLIKSSPEVAFYTGKISSARYFMKNILPEIYGMTMAIRNEDMSAVKIEEECFAV